VGSTQPSAFVIDTTSGDVSLNSKNYSNGTTTLEECVELLYDQSIVTLFASNCSLAAFTVGFGDNDNITTDVITAEKIEYEDLALHQWGNSSGFLGLGNKQCIEDSCFNQSRPSFQEILKTVYQTSVFGLDLNNDTTPSFMDIGSINPVYANVFEWAPRQIATFPQYYDFILHDLQFCNVNIMSNLSTNWQSRVDTASACLALPAELYNNVISWLDLTVEVEQLNGNWTKDDVLHHISLPDLTFSLNNGGKTLHISLNDLLIDSSELKNLPNTPEILLSRDGVTVSSNLSLCLLAGDYVDIDSSSPTPVQIVLGSLALRALYVGIDVDANSPRIGFANKRAIATDSEMALQCAAPITCSGSQYTSRHQNSCRNPDCRKYFYAALNEETHTCEYDNGSIVVGILFIVIFASCEIIAFFVSQYTSYMVIPQDSRKFSVDIVTLKIGEILTSLVDRLIIDVLCWMPDDHAANAVHTPVGHEEEVEVDMEDDAHNFNNMFLNFDETYEQHILQEHEDVNINNVDYEEDTDHLVY
jgi:hypothetical protein